uniref:Uncharacterized protein n=1 Tax=Rhizophora mucronata TaxID=61149 RepID=A0A2P2QJK2_RHIMU
MIADHVILS